MSWYDMVYSAIRGLEHYDPQNKKWGQAHVRASFALLQVMLRDAKNLVKLEKTKIKKDNKEIDYVFIHLNKEEIWKSGKHAVGEFLKA